MNTEDPIVAWSTALQAFETGTPEGKASLYFLFHQDAARCLSKQLRWQEVDDSIHDAFTAFLAALQHGTVREPERIRSFAYTIIKRGAIRQINAYCRERRSLSLDESVPIRHGRGDGEAGRGSTRGSTIDRGCMDKSNSLVDDMPRPDEQAEKSQRHAIVMKTIRGMQPRDREIITRTFILDQDPEQVCAEMGLTPIQFRLLKSRAKGRLMGRFIAMGVCPRRRSSGSHRQKG